MDTVKMEKQKKLLMRAKDDILYEKNQLMDNYEKLEDVVIKTGIISLISALFQIICVGAMLKSKNVVLMGLGRYLTPFVLLIFTVAFLTFIIKGFDFFINMDTELSEKASKKLDKVTYVEKIAELNNSIIRIDIELEKINKKLGSEDDIIASEMLDDYVDDDNKIEYEPRVEINNTENISKYEEVNIIDTERKKKESDILVSENVDDILNALDYFGLGDEDDDFENSSELWKRDSKLLN